MQIVLFMDCAERNSIKFEILNGQQNSDIVVRNSVFSYCNAVFSIMNKVFIEKIVAFKIVFKIYICISTR